MQIKKLRCSPSRSFSLFLFLSLFLCLFHGKAMGNFPSIPSLPNTMMIPAPPALQAKSYILIDYLSDYVIAEHDAEQRVEPASLTKMMTVYVADQALKNNKIKLTDPVKISEKAWRATGSRMFLELNSEVPVAELIKGIIIQSGNDASIAMAEHIAGSETNFAGLMNYFAKELGMVNTHFVNATGLPDPDHYTTARDMALLAKAIIRDFPESYAVYSQKEFTFHNIKQTNRNRLLWKHDWVDGIKTGHTDSAGFCLVASGQQAGMRLIAVMMGAKSDALRTDETNNLLTYGFQFYETRKFYPKSTAVKVAKVWMGKNDEVGLGLTEDLYVTVSKGQFDRLKTDIDVEKVIKAPMTEGAVLGTLSVQLDDKTISKRPIVALQGIPEANIFSRMLDFIKLFFHSLWEKVS